jgi:hypothetical protein
MKEWFKARNVWGAAITALSDDEAGRLAKAIWAYTMSGEIQEIEGAGKGIFAMIIMTLAQDAEHDADVSAKRSDAAKSMHLQANADKCKQLYANDDIKNKNKNKNKNKEQESESESEYIPVTEARRIQLDHDTIIGAAENAGFKMSNDVSTELIALYAQHGMQKVMDGLKSCVEHGVPNLAYLKACMTGEPKKKGKVNAQQYDQRDYDEEQAEAMRRMIKAVNA